MAMKQKMRTKREGKGEREEAQIGKKKDGRLLAPISFIPPTSLDRSSDYHKLHQSAITEHAAQASLPCVEQ